MMAERRFRIPRLAQAVLTVGLVYVGFRLMFDVALGQPIPASLMTMYMFFVVSGVFMVFTFTEEQHAGAWSRRSRRWSRTRRKN